MASAVARAYNGGLGAVPPAGSRVQGQRPWSGGLGGEAPQKLNTTIHFISQFSPNLGVIFVYDIQYNEHHTTKVSLIRGVDHGGVAGVRTPPENI